MTHTEALKLALEALEWHAGGCSEDGIPNDTVAAIEAIRAALAAPAAVPWQRNELAPDVAPMLASAAPAAPSVPHGWKLVPVEPTYDMLRASLIPEAEAARYYGRMLAAAPTDGGQHG